MTYSKEHDELTELSKRTNYPLIFNGSEMASLVASVTICKDQILSRNDPMKVELQEILDKIAAAIHKGPICEVCLKAHAMREKMG